MSSELTLSTKIKQILLVTERQMIGSIILAIAIFLIEYSAFIFRVFEDGSAVPEGIAAQTVSQEVSRFLQYINDLPYANNIATALFWALAAIFLYIAYNIAKNIVIDARNEVIVDTSYANNSIGQLLVRRFSRKIAIVLGFFALIALTALFLLPYWMGLLTIFVYSGLLLKDTPFLIMGLCGLAVNIYAVWIFAHFLYMDLHSRNSTHIS